MADSTVSQVGQWVNPTAEDWGYLECMTWRQQTGDQMKNYKVGETFNFRAGYKVFTDAADTDPKRSVSRFDYEYTLVE